MMNQLIIQPEHTAVRVALWRALHTLIDDRPYIFEDTIGAEIVGEKNWQDRQDMEPTFSKPMRASITGRARFIEDLIQEKVNEGIDQYILLGAGLDTFAQRRAELANKISIFEIDQPGPQEWKQRRLKELNFPIPDNLKFIPVDFEKGESWIKVLQKSNFDINKPAVIVSTGVSMYLSHETNKSLLKEISKFQKGTTFAMTFMLSLELLEEKEKSLMEFVMKKAAESDTPFLSLYSPKTIIEMSISAGFSKAEYISAKNIYQKYFSKRNDGLNAGNAEAFLVAVI